MYQALLLDHYQYPRNKGTLGHADFSSHHHNPSCGDVVAFQGIIDPATEILTGIAFTGTGCVLSQATASLLSEHALELSIRQIELLDKHTIFSLITMELGPTRLKCALLPLEALQNGIAVYRQKEKIDNK